VEHPHDQQIENLRYSRVQLCATVPRSAFTLIEIALALAVIGFALAAIIGVMPFGMDAQRDNRQKTIITEDATIWMNAIRNGNDGLDGLTNHVLYVANHLQAFNTLNNSTVGDPRSELFESPMFIFQQGGAVPVNIIGLASTPKYRPCADTNVSNYRFIETNTQVNVYCRAMSGSAMDASTQLDPKLKDSTFSYRLTVENTTNPTRGNSHELRLTFRWPLRANGEAGPGKAVFRTQISGRLDLFLVQTKAGRVQQYFFAPGQY
jgi:type II secretory pathway pseudopilin PulG